MGVNARVGSAPSGAGGIVSAKKMYLCSADKLRLQGQGQVTSVKSGQMEEGKGDVLVVRDHRASPRICGLLVWSWSAEILMASKGEQ